jgi:hypothetical protein
LLSNIRSGADPADISGASRFGGFFQLDSSQDDFTLMDDIDEIRLGILRAQLELCEIEILALSREILSPLTNSRRRADAVARRDDLSTERPQIAKELDGLISPFRI